MLRKVLVWFLISASCGSAFLIFVRVVTEEPGESGVSESVSEALLRVYENFLLRTKTNYQDILEAGTHYDNHDKVFMELTDKMQNLDTSGLEYANVKAQLYNEIQKNQSAFELFYQKVSHTSPAEMSETIRKFQEKSREHDKALNDLLNESDGKLPSENATEKR
jgi:hypothetical protein